MQVVVGVVDPNPLVGGSGLRLLQGAGVSVCQIGGPEETAAENLNPAFMARMRAQAAGSS